MSTVVESSILSMIVDPDMRSVAAPYLEEWMFSHEWGRAFIRCIKQPVYAGKIPSVREFVVDLHNQHSLSPADCEYAAQILLDYREIEDVDSCVARIQDWVRNHHVRSGVELMASGEDKDSKERGIEVVQAAASFQIAVDTFYDFSDPEAVKKAREEDLPEGTRIMPSSFNVVNKASTYGGFKYGDLIMVLAETGVGKTTAIVSESAHHAQQGLKVANFVLGDMTEHDMFLMYLSNMSRTETAEILANGHDRYMTPDVNKWLGNIRVKALAPDAYDIHQILAKADQLYKKFKFDVLTIDYDGNIRDSAAGANSYFEGGTTYANAKGYGKGKCATYIASQTKIMHWGEELIQKSFANDSSKKQHHLDYIIGLGRNKDCPMIGTVNLPKVRRGRSGLFSRVHLDNGKGRVYEIRGDRYEEIKQAWKMRQQDNATYDMT